MNETLQLLAVGGIFLILAVVFHFLYRKFKAMNTLPHKIRAKFCGATAVFMYAWVILIGLMAITS